MKKTFKHIIILFLSFISFSLYGQEVIPDTILVRTEFGPMITDTTRHYVVHGSQEMVINISNEKKDSVFFNEISNDIRKLYDQQLELIKIRALPIDKIYADMVFDYFLIGETIENVTKKLGKKKIHVTYTGYQVAFYDKYSKKNEVFDFEFRGGKLWTIHRQSTNTLPTNDVWEAFELVEIEQNLKDLNAAVEKLKAKKTKKSNQKKRAKNRHR